DELDALIAGVIANDADEIFTRTVERGNEVLGNELHCPRVFFVRVKFDSGSLEILPFDVVKSVVMKDHGLEQHEDFLFFGGFHANRTVKIQTKSKTNRLRWGIRTGQRRFCRRAAALCG